MFLGSSTTNQITKTTVESPLGPLTAAFQGEDLIGLWFEGQKYYPSKAKDWLPSRGGARDSQLRQWLAAYFAGEKPEPFPGLRPPGTFFQMAVWAELERIAYGQTITYGQIAGILAQKLSFNPRSAQAVGGAVAHNPISILIPCHRVIGNRGSLTGYAGGLDRKKILLSLEGFTDFLPT
ncbi:MAG: methylated-DNA--[protein]-cysteine S-methyltransferase [Deltaproteobacteria bacterium]|jgi:methylated-DNA-[protein]-cysteine S-methyltransferase|nr:methylated-DNA--[protein]-cysteine S-methyltransferase [Deltaproteobacteria bacterium]